MKSNREEDVWDKAQDSDMCNICGAVKDWKEIDTNDGLCDHCWHLFRGEGTQGLSEY